MIGLLGHGLVGSTGDVGDAMCVVRCSPSTAMQPAQRLHATVIVVGPAFVGFQPAALVTVLRSATVAQRDLAGYRPLVLLDGVNHVAIITNDTERLHAFYRAVFDATVSNNIDLPGGRLSFIDVGRSSTSSGGTATPKPIGKPRCSGAAGSTTSGCKRHPWRPSRRSAGG